MKKSCTRKNGIRHHLKIKLHYIKIHQIPLNLSNTVQSIVPKIHMDKEAMLIVVLDHLVDSSAAGILERLQFKKTGFRNKLTSLRFNITMINTIK